MNYYTFHCSRIGAEHIRIGLPLQDSSVSWQFGQKRIAIVADGHGSRRHFRSETGSELACRTALEKIRCFLDDYPADPQTMEERLENLELEICLAWRDAVIEDHRIHPWTEDELNEEMRVLTPEQFAELKEGGNVLIPYGSTLCAAFSVDDKWAAIQLGDGGIVHISREGEYTWPMPESRFNSGNKTASLCMKQPMEDFRHCFGCGNPAGILVFSDGIDKTFPEQSHEIVSFLYWVWNNGRRNGDSGSEVLEKVLDSLSEQSRIGDDVSVAGFIDQDLEDIRPKITGKMREREKKMADARVSELKITLDYNRKQLFYLRETGGNPESIEKITEIIAKTEKKLAGLIPDYEPAHPEEVPEKKIDDKPDPAVPAEETNSDIEAERNPEDMITETEVHLAPEFPKLRSGDSFKGADSGSTPESKKGPEKNKRKNSGWVYPSALILIFVLLACFFLISMSKEKKRIAAAQSTADAVAAGQTGTAAVQHTQIAVMATENRLEKIMPAEEAEKTRDAERISLKNTEAAIRGTQTYIAFFEEQRDLEQMTETITAMETTQWAIQMMETQTSFQMTPEYGDSASETPEPQTDPAIDFTEVSEIIPGNIMNPWHHRPEDHGYLNGRKNEVLEMRKRD